MCFFSGEERVSRALFVRPNARRTHTQSCGDVLDRGADDWRCLTYLRSLRDEARCAGGDVALVLGNHEVLNVLGDVRFVCVEAMHAVANAFDDAQLPKLIARQTQPESQKAAHAHETESE